MSCQKNFFLISTFKNLAPPKKGFFLLKRSFFIFLIIYSFLFLLQKENSFIPFKNHFDNNQYLFSQEKGILFFSELNILEGSFFKPVSPSFLISSQALASLDEIESQKEIKEYIVQSGDNLSSIAKKFNISLETLLWANNLSYRSIIKPGDKLMILPVSGVLHIVRKGDTLSQLAKIYKVEIEKIVKINQLSDASNIYIGDLLIIPGGKKPKVSQRYFQVPLPTHYFICPIPPPCKITQGLHWFNAVDLSNGKCGEPVFAAAGGKIQRTGYGRIPGYYVRILHPNGVVTFYGHLSKIKVKKGETVYQGQIIGYIGHSGLTQPVGPKGCHLHFDVRFAKNPFAL